MRVRRIARWWVWMALIGQAALLCAGEVAVPKLQIESYRLPNGLKVALSYDPGAPTATVCVAYHVGSKNERAGLSGFAHFFEHMMFRGTKHVPNYDMPLQAGGGSPNAFTSNDMTVYFESIPANYLERALYMEAERMAFLPTALDQQKFDTEREIVKNERWQRMENVPYGLASETIGANLFPKGHPYSWSVIGSMKDLDNATLDDLRNFFWEFYHPGNATLAVVGNFDVEKTKAWIEKYFAPIPAGKPIPAIDVPRTPSVNRRITTYDRVQFPRVYWAWPTVSETHRDAPALDLLADILSSGDASRLRQALMIRHTLATQVSADSDTRELDGLFTVSATVAPGSSIEKVEQALAQQLERIRKDGPTADELNRALAKHEHGFLQSLTSVTMRAFAIAMGYAQHNDPHYYQKTITDYVRVTPADIQRVAAKYLVPQKLVLEIVPPPPGKEETPAVLVGPTVPNDRGVEPRHVQDEAVYATMPEPANAAPPLKVPTIQRHTLSNGLEVWMAEWKTLPLVAVQLVVPVGASATTAEEAGLATLTARCWDEGTQSMTATEFTQALESLGVSLGVNAGTQTTQVGFSVGTSRLPQSLELMAQMLATPRFDDKDVARERKLILSALTRVRDNPQAIAGRVFPRLLYGTDHPFGRPASGYLRTVEHLTAEQVRTFHRDYLRPRGAALIVVGDIDPDTLLPILEEKLGIWKGRPKEITLPPVPQESTSGQIFVVHKPGAVQSVLMAGRRWKGRRDPSYPAARVANRIIGGDFVSRINKNLRERNGFTYGARSGFRFLKTEGRWVLQTAVRGNVTGAALREVVQELQAAATSNPPNQTEFTVAKQAELSSLDRAFETPSSIANLMLEMAVFDLPQDYFSKRSAELEQVALKDVHAVARTLLPPSRQVVLIVGDRKSVLPQLKKAGFENVTVLDGESGE